MTRTQDRKPWDAQLAYRLVYPFRASALTPNHLTSLRLLFGLLAFTEFSLGKTLHTNVAAVLFCISNFLDHADGELARLTGKSSRAGHYYDLLSDALINILLFVGIGIGLRSSSLGGLAVPLGIMAGVAVAIIFQLRHDMETQLGKLKARQPNAGIFEAEDVLYLLPLVTLSGLLQPFLLLAAIGAPLFSLWVFYEHMKMKQIR